MSDSRTGQRKQTVLLLVLAVGMFGFAFALVPLYNLFCEVTGLNGKIVYDPDQLAGAQ